MNGSIPISSNTVQSFKRISCVEEEFGIEGISIEQLLSGEASLDTAVRSDIWIEGNECIAPTPWNPRDQGSLSI